MDRPKLAAFVVAPRHHQNLGGVTDTLISFMGTRIGIINTQVDSMDTVAGVIDTQSGVVDTPKSVITTKSALVALRLLLLLSPPAIIRTWFRGGLVFKAQRLSYHSTLGSSRITQH